MKKHAWFWICLFIVAAVLISALATGWNVVLVRDYQRLLQLTRNVSLPIELRSFSTHLILKMIVGTLGFVGILAATLILFIRLLKEMRLNQLQAEFIATVTHELKSPIAAIELATSLIRTGNLRPQESEQLWESHQLELKRLREQVDALLEAARWQSRPNLLEKKPVCLEHWLQEQWPKWQVILGPNATLTRAGEPLKHWVDVDIRTLDLIVANLLGNAKKFAREIPRVTIRTSLVDESSFLRRILGPRLYWRVEFKDEGWGFHPKDASRIFQRFYRSKNLAPYAIPGTGLGLFLAKQACRALHLTLTAESLGFGCGAQFILQGSIRP